MRAFAELLDRLSLTPSRNAKLTLVRDYLRDTPDPDRGWALAALTGDLTFDAAKPTFIRKAVEERMDPQLFWWSYDYVGDLAETVALVWPRRPGANREPELNEVVEGLRTATRAEVQRLIEGWLDAMDEPRERWALLKLMTRELRVGLTARLAKRAAAELGGVEPAEIEELWHALHPPYEDLFAWLEGRSEKPSSENPGRFRPVMLAQAIDERGEFPVALFRRLGQEEVPEWDVSRLAKGFELLERRALLAALPRLQLGEALGQVRNRQIGAFARPAQQFGFDVNPDHAASSRTSILPVTAAEMSAVRYSRSRSMDFSTFSASASILAVSRSRKAAMARCSGKGGPASSYVAISLSLIAG